MLRRTSIVLGVNGFYIALHPWLQVAGYVKVGFSASLETRLNMPTFKSCFTDEWQYHTVFECEGQKEALLLEQSVLFCFADKRVLHRELLRCSGDEVAAMARAVSRKLNLAVVEKAMPVYETPVKRKPGSRAAAGTDTDRDPCARDDASEEVVTFPQDLQQTIAPYMDTLQKFRSALHRKPSNIDTAGVTGAADDDSGEYNDIVPLFGNPSRKLVIGKEADADEEEPDEHILDHAVGLLRSKRSPHYYGASKTPSETPMVEIDAENYTLEGLRPYQVEAVERARRELALNGKTICQMACRCGKTPVAFHILREYTSPAKKSGSATGRVLYLVPGLTLLRQTAQKLFNYGLQSVPILLIGSDTNPVLLGGAGWSDDASVGSHSPAWKSATMTTDPTIIRDFLLHNSHGLVISTYHSSPLLEPLINMFSLSVFDECHRVCGSSDKTSFNTVLLLPPGPHRKRLFLTATPTYDTPIRMSNEQLFGGIAYRYYLREGIDSGFVNPFCVRVVLGHSLDDMSPYILEAMRHVDKMIVFCRNIKHAEQLYKQLAAAGGAESNGSDSDDPRPFAAFIAHSRMGSTQVGAALAEFSSHKRCLLFNVRLFQEGVEIPDLNAVFFAAPRYSSRDIVQSICRPLNKLPNKPISHVFLPAAMNSKFSASHPINLRNFSTLVPFTDALMDEDPTLFEYMLDPLKKSYDFDVVGLRSLKLTSEKIENFVLPAVRRGVRYSSTTQSDRLHRAARLPWKYVFAEMKRIVLECNRYPKTNDAWVVGDTSVSMNLFYRYVRKGYALYQAGDQTYLQTYQIRDLESLPQWTRFGVKGPYPWRECLATLERHLAKNTGRMPPLDVHKGGFVGLDATPFERLSGCLMHVNQCDAAKELRLAPEKQRDMDELCKRHGLKWRKTRNGDGTLRRGERTFITDSYIAFKQLVGQVDQLPEFRRYLDRHFPGYPEKHARMEDIAILGSGKVPPRHKPMKRLSMVNHLTAKQLRKAHTKKEKVLKNRKKTKPQAPESPQERSVMCRICRTNVRAADWENHIVGPEHLSAAKSTSQPKRSNSAAAPLVQFQF